MQYTIKGQEHVTLMILMTFKKVITIVVKIIMPTIKS